MNPIPVVVLLVPASRNPHGVVAIKRAIQPAKGQWALPSGFVDHKETWQEAALREFKEELGVDPKCAPTGLKLLRVDPSSDRRTMLLFVGLPFQELSVFTESFRQGNPDNEVEDIRLIEEWDTHLLCWSTHQENARAYIQRHFI